MRGLLWMLVMLCLWSGSWASDLAREERIANQISDALLVGEPLYLEAGGNRFLGIYAEEETDYSQGAAILLHGRGAHPDWIDVINPLRSRLTEYGWKTLSIQLPIAASDASDWVYPTLIPEAFPRIDAAVAYLRQQGVSNLVLVGHSLGARMGAEYLAQAEPGTVKAFVAIGISADPARPDQGTLAAFRRLKLPLLDLYGSQDIPAVLRSVNERKTAAREAGNGEYRQTVIQGADHFFRGLDDTLLAEVRAWLGRTAPGIKVVR